jgi:uncharacterized membrane protein YcfT
MNNTGLPKTNRVDWIDYAKGMCIIWVVTLYATAYVQEITHAPSWMDAVVDFGRPFRMPDFFLLSGLFVSRVINRPLRSYIDSKVLYFIYFYAVWVTLKFVNMELYNLLGSADRLPLLLSYLKLYVEPPTGPLWFIYILALFFLAVRLVRSLPVPLVMAVAVLLEVADLQTGLKAVDEFTHFFVFFYAGYVGARYVFGAAEWARAHARIARMVFAAWFLANAVLVSNQLTHLPGMPLIMGFAGAFAVSLLATQLAGVAWLGWLRYLGQNSIVVYLGFVIPIGLMRRYIAPSASIADPGTVSFMVMVLAVAGAVLLYWGLRNSPLWWLYKRPSWTSIASPRPVAVPSEAPTQGVGH